MDDVEEPPGIDPPQEDRNWALAAHLAPALVNAMGGVGGWIVPLVIGLAHRDTRPFVRAEAKESLNFRITMILSYLVAWLLYFSVIFMCIGIPLLGGLWIFELVVSILASVEVQNGRPYRYPVCLRVIS